MKIFVPRETRANETRVGLIPEDVMLLVNQGHAVWIEQGAGQAAGFADADYRQAGAAIRPLMSDELEGYQQLYQGIDVILRVKRPAAWREGLENQAIASGTVMVGALDPGEKLSTHWQAYQAAGIDARSIDQLSLPSDDEMNILSSMSRMAGQLALQDALSRKDIVEQVVLIGAGTAGWSAMNEALSHQLLTTVIVTNLAKKEKVEAAGAMAVWLDTSTPLSEQQHRVCELVKEADIVMTSARRANQPAPLLIPAATLAVMKKGAVVVDLALSEGGNVEGSEHDKVKVLGNEVIVINTSGYPKSCPRDASRYWSHANRLYVERELSK